MSDQTWTDDDLDALLRTELTRMAGANPSPRVSAPSARRLLRPRLGGGQPRGTRRLAPLGIAIAVAVVVAGGGGAWFATHRGQAPAGGPAPASSPTPQGTPAPTPAPTTPTPSQGPPPPAVVSSTVSGGVALVYYLDGSPPAATVRLDAVDWSGTARGHIDVTEPGGAPPLLEQSPDGGRLLVDGVVYTSAGQRVGSVTCSAPTKGGCLPSWSDDGRALCSLRRIFDDPSVGGGPSRAWLDELTPGAAARQVLELPPLPGDQMGWDLLSCSGLHDRVTLLQSGGDGVPLILLEVRLSTGAVLYRHDFCTAGTCGSARSLGPATADGRYVGEAGMAPDTFQVWDTVTGRLTDVHAHGAALRFTADGAQVLVDDYGSTSAPATIPGLSLVDWRTGRVTWTLGNREAGPTGVLVEPGGTRIAVASTQYAPNQGSPPPGAVFSIDILTPGAATSSDRRVADGTGGMFTPF